MEEKPKFHFKITLTEEDFVRYNRKLTWRNKITYFNMLLTGVIAVTVTLSVMHYYRLFDTIPSYWQYIIGIALFVFASWQFRRVVDQQAITAFRVNSLGMEWDMQFGSTEFEVDCTAGKSIHRYSDLNEIILTDKDVYLMYKQNAGYCLRKDLCPAGFVEFIEEQKRKTRR
ncbi:MAG: hypothetical protein II551_07320 [Paludibacteraceae bacterium]|nr:hypothetical protein [Paludibacteraceae bacterium]